MVAGDWSKTMTTATAEVQPDIDPAGQAFERLLDWLGGSADDDGLVTIKSLCASYDRAYEFLTELEPYIERWRRSCELCDRPYYGDRRRDCALAG